jgi:hypothetical protein
MTLEELRLVVARTTAVLPEGPIHGTAFLVSKTHILTCAHCLGEEAEHAREVALDFSRWPPNVRLQRARLVEVDWKRDVALLALTGKPAAHSPREQPEDADGHRSDLTPAPEAPTPPPPLARNAPLMKEWLSFSHPTPVGTDGIVLTGVVLDPDGRAYDKPAIQLHCNQAQDKVRGASGSPVLVDGCIVAILTKQLLVYAGREDTLAPAYHTVYALALESVVLPAFASQATVFPSTEHAERSARRQKQLRLYRALAEGDYPSLAHLNQEPELLQYLWSVQKLIEDQLPPQAFDFPEVAASPATAEVAATFTPRFTAPALAVHAQETGPATPAPPPGVRRVC